MIATRRLGGDDSPGTSQAGKLLKHYKAVLLASRKPTVGHGKRQLLSGHQVLLPLKGLAKWQRH